MRRCFVADRFIQWRAEIKAGRVSGSLLPLGKEVPVMPRRSPSPAQGEGGVPEALYRHSFAVNKFTVSPRCHALLRRSKALAGKTHDPGPERGRRDSERSKNTPTRIDYLNMAHL
jgi:hypothetical protein